MIQDATVSTRLRNRATIRQPERLTYETMSAMTEGMHGTAAELRYLGNLCELDNEEIATAFMTAENIELSNVGAGIGGGFGNTSELKVMNLQGSDAKPGQRSLDRGDRKREAKVRQVQSRDTGTPRSSTGRVKDIDYHLGHEEKDQWCT